MPRMFPLSAIHGLFQPFFGCGLVFPGPAASRQTIEVQQHGVRAALFRGGAEGLCGRFEVLIVASGKPVLEFRFARDTLFLFEG